jgi:hypothetical protein
VTENSKIVQAIDVVGVTVRKQHRVDLGDIRAEKLEP